MGKEESWTTKVKRKITYHGRKGKPTIRLTKNTLEPYIMVRKVGGGVKRLYIRTANARKEITKGFRGLYSSAMTLSRIAKKERRKRG